MIDTTFRPFERTPTAEDLDAGNAQLEMNALLDALEPLWAQVPGGLVTVCDDSPRFKRTAVVSADPLDREGFVDAVRGAMVAGRRRGQPANLYFSTQPFDAGKLDARIAAKKTARGEREDVAAIVCLAADIDTADGVHKSRTRLPTRDEARAMLTIAPPGPPSLVVDTGGGYHAYWLLTEPLPYDAEAQKLLDRWAGWLAAYGKAAGFRVDSGCSKNPSLVLRVPGTFNEKLDPATKEPRHQPVWIHTYEPGITVAPSKLDLCLPDLDDLRDSPATPSARPAPAEPADPSVNAFNRDRGALEDLLRAAGCREVFDGWVRPGSTSQQSAGSIYTDDDAVRIGIFGTGWQEDWGLEGNGSEIAVTLRPVDVISVAWLGGNAGADDKAHLVPAYRIVEAFSGDVPRIIAELESSSTEDLLERYSRRDGKRRRPVPTLAGPASLVDVGSLSDRAEQVADAGLHLVPTIGRKPGLPSGNVDADTQAATEAVAAGESATLGLRLGSATRTTDEDGDSRWTMALDFEGDGSTRPKVAAEFVEALTRAGMADLAARLRDGWAERTSGSGERLYFRLAASDARAWEVIEDQLIGSGREIRASGDLLASIKTSGYALIAPSVDSGEAWRCLSGGPATIPDLNLGEVLALGRTMRRLSSGSTQRGGEAAVDPRTEKVADTFDLAAQGGDGRLLELLDDAGWADAGTSPAGARSFTRGEVTVEVGGPWAHPGSLTCYDRAAGDLYGAPSAFTVHLRLTNDARTAAGYPPLTAVEFAEELVAENGLHVDDQPLFPAERLSLDLNVTDTAESIKATAGAISAARHPFIVGLPLWIRVDASGVGRGAHLACLESSGRLVTRTIADADTVAMSVVQPVYVTQKKDGSESEKIQHSFPRSIARPAVQHVLASETTFSVRRVVNTPFVAPSGEIVTTPGVHAPSGSLLVIPDKERYLWATRYSPPVGPITAEQAQEALDLLLDEMLVDFPFATPGDRARAVAYLLTVTNVPLIPVRPIVAADSSERGSGKSKLITLGRLLATGSPSAQSISHSRRSDDETRKQAASAYLSGQRFLHVDELPRGQKLDSLVITELATAQDGQVAYRVLGGNDVVALSGMTITVCGNNIDVGGDLTRRVVMIRLVHNGEGRRQDKVDFRHHDLEGWVLGHRAELLAACHTLVAHGIQQWSDHPKKWSGLGSFEEWKRIVLGAMQHVTIDGQAADELVLEDRRAWEEDQDDENEEWGEFMAAWAALAVGDGTYLSARELLEKLGKGTHHLPTSLIPLGGMPTAKLWSRQLKLRRQTRVSTPVGLLSIDVKSSRQAGNGFRIVRHGS